MDLQRLKDMREDADLSQADVARKISVAQNTYSQYENGVRSIPIVTLSLLADLFHTSVDYLIGRTDVKKPYPRGKGKQKEKK